MEKHKKSREIIIMHQFKYVTHTSYDAVEKTESITAESGNVPGSSQ